MRAPPSLQTLLFLILATLGTSCVHKSYEATSLEPLTITGKKDMELSASKIGYKFWKLNYSYALNNWLALRAGYSGFVSLDNFDAGAFFYKNASRFNFFAGPVYNYQHNYIHCNISPPLIDFRSFYRYNCEYSSPGLAFGFSIKNSQQAQNYKFSIGVLGKISYNIIQQYNYTFFVHNDSGGDIDINISGAQNSIMKTPNFISGDLSLYALIPFGKGHHFKMQLGNNFCQQSFTNQSPESPTSYLLKGSSGNLVSAYQRFNSAFYMSFGVILKRPLKK